MNEELLRRFVREPDCSWRCVEAAELYLPGGRRIQVTCGENSRTAGSGV